VLAKKYAGSSSDMWSFGVVLFMLVTGEPPFWGETNAEIMGMVKRMYGALFWDRSFVSRGVLFIHSSIPGSSHFLPL
jgi:serine/threonine protein kinase